MRYIRKMPRSTSNGRVRGIYTWPSIIMAVAGFGAVPTEAQTVSFVFAPPDGTNFNESCSIEKQYSQKGEEPETIRDSFGSRYSIVSVESGYEVTMRPSEMPRMPDVPSEMTNLIEAIMRLAPKVYLNDRGQGTSVSGFDELSEVLEQMLPAEMIQLLETGIGRPLSGSTFLEEWNNRQLFGAFAGQSFELDQIYSSEYEQPLPDGRSAQFKGNFSVTGPIECDTHDCVLVSAIQESEDLNLSSSVTQAFNALRNEMATVVGRVDSTAVQEMMESSNFRITSLVLTAREDRLIDPGTGLPHGKELVEQHDVVFEHPTEGTSSGFSRTTTTCRYTYLDSTSR